MVTATKDSVYYSKDGGENWTSLGSMSKTTPGVKAVAVAWPDEECSMVNGQCSMINVMDLISQHKVGLVINVPKNHTSRELTNGYKIRRGAIDHNIPLMTNVRLAKAFIEAFTAMSIDDVKIKSWQEYNN